MSSGRTSSCSPLCFLSLPAEIIWRIFLSTDCPRFVYRSLPTTCRTFHRLISSSSLVIQANVELKAEDDDSGDFALISPPEPLKMLKRFRLAVVPERRDGVVGDAATGGSNKPPADPLHRLVYIGAEREIKINMGAVPARPATLVDYITELLRRGGAAGGGARHVRVVFGRVQVQGKRGSCPADLLGAFLGVMSPLNITTWCWDTDLIKEISERTSPSTLRLPNMKGDGCVVRADLGLLSNLTSLRRLELFRPMPRQPWGLESNAFSALENLPNLRELAVGSGRLIGGHEPLVTALLKFPNLTVVELPWNLDGRSGARLLHGLPNLSTLQFVHINSPDFWLSLPSHARMDSFAAWGTPPVNGLLPGLGPLSNMKSLGIHYMQPDTGDFAVMVEGVIRSFVGLHELVVRISRTNDGDYDFFAAMPREYIERLLRRLERKTALKAVSLELGLRFLGSRKSYVDELVGAFAASRMK
ncbi:hypothetical protein HK104_000786, partial [Borealophlyctis nickersoniae]